jgi:hypothetical protein
MAGVGFTIKTFAPDLEMELTNLLRSDLTRGIEIFGMTGTSPAATTMAGCDMLMYFATFD